MRRGRLWFLAVGVAIAVVVAGCGEVETTPPIGAPWIPPTPGGDDLIVRDGDTVEVTGQVIAAPGQAVVFCPPRASADDPQVPVMRPGETPKPVVTPAPTCPATLAVTLTGVDLDRLSSSQTIQGTQTGWATLRGPWHGRAIDVTEQTEPKQTTVAPGNVVPCPASADARKVFSMAEGERIARRVGDLMNDNAYPHTGVAIDTQNGRARVALFIITEQLYEKFKDLCPDPIELAPVVRPVR